VTALPSEQAQPTPEQVWKMALDQLHLQMTQATFDTWLKNTHIISTENGAWHIGVKNKFAKDWLENRLFSTINRTMTHIVGQAVDLQFVVDTEDTISEPAPNDFELSANDLIAANQDSTDLEYAQFVLHVKTIGGKTGYKPMPDYYINYWSQYLAARWKTAGSRAFRLRQILLTLDIRKVTGPDFTNWSPIIETNYEELGDLIGVDRAVITGRDGHCQKYENDRKEGHPRGFDCCGRHEADGCRIKPSQRSGLEHCYFWRIGVLDVLDAEGLIATDKQGKTRGHKLRLQVWHSLPILTPFQVDHLPQRLREKHHSWLIEAAPKLGLSVQAWEDTPHTIESFVDQAEDYDLARIFYGCHQLNPYR
jgi:hypothetical protein